MLHQLSGSARTSVLQVGLQPSFHLESLPFLQFPILLQEWRNLGAECLASLNGGCSFVIL